jgi:hypothetical protein
VELPPLCPDPASHFRLPARDFFFLRLFSFLFRVRSLRTPLHLKPAWVEGARGADKFEARLQTSIIGLGLGVFLVLILTETNLCV